MAIYTMYVEPEDRPNLLNRPNVWAVVDDTTEHIICYCLSHDDAERIKVLLAYYGDLGHMQQATNEGG